MGPIQSGRFHSVAAFELRNSLNLITGARCVKYCQTSKIMPLDQAETYFFLEYRTRIITETPMYIRRSV